MNTKLLLAACAVLSIAIPAFAADQKAIVKTPDQLQWTDASKQFGKGAESVVLAGDPRKKGPYVLRLKLPANAAFPAHTHPTAEVVTVLNGTIVVGFGKHTDQSKGQPLPAGSFIEIPANTPHYAWTTQDDTIIEVHGVGPSVFNMLEKPKTASAAPIKQ
jgi:quercetin dioxygenase-like cupin family protein